MNNLKKIFKKDKVVIGVIHLMSLLGYAKYQGIDIVLGKALRDLKSYEKGGIDGVIIENNYDFPHKIFVGPETVVCMTYITSKIIERTKLPIGISVLWNDFKAALAIAKVNGAKFVRVPVFVDDVKTQYGSVNNSAREVITYRRSIKAENIALFTDIHVKHAKLVSKYSLEGSAKKAIQEGSDGLIITGKWTGEAPVMGDVSGIRESVGNFPVLIGSGVNINNVGPLLKYADGVIVATSLKTGMEDKKNVNIKREQEAIDIKKVKNFIKEFRKVR